MPTKKEARRNRKAAERNKERSGLPSVEGCKDGEWTDGERQRDDMKQNENKPVHWTAIAEAICAILLISITAYYAYWANQQATASIIAANAAKSTADTAAMQLGLAQRPWVGPDFDKTVIDPIVDGQKITWLVFYKNYGNSPALHIRWKTRLYPWEVIIPDWNALESDIENLPLEDWDVTLFNGARLPNAGTTPEAAPPGYAQRLESKASQTVLGGRIQYLDEFDKPHETTFCIIYAPPKGNEPATWYTCPVKPKAT